MLIFKLVFAILLPTILGFCLVTCLLTPKRTPFSFRLSLAYGAGMAAVALWLLLLSLFRLPLSGPTTIFPLLLIAVSSAVWLYTKRNAYSDDLFVPVKKETGFSDRPLATQILTVFFYAFLFIYFAANLYYIFWRSLNIPIYTWDAISTIAFKAKVFYYEQSLQSLTQLPHKGYPLFVPFLEVWTAIALGQWHEQWIKIIFPLAFLSFVGITYHFLKFYTNRAWAALGLALLFSSNLFIIQATVAYRDFFMTYYFCASIMLLLLWGRLRQNGLLVLSGFFIAMGSFVKVEGIAYVLILGVLFLVMVFLQRDKSKKEKIFSAVLFFFISFSILFMYYIYKYFILSVGVIGSETKMKITTDVNYLSRIPKLIWAFFENMFLISNWGIVWFIALLSLVHFFIKDKKRECVLLLLSFAMFFGFYFLVGLITPSFKWLATEVRMSTLGRVILHAYPLAPLFIILSNYEEFSLCAADPNPHDKAHPSPKFNKKKKKKKKRKK